MKESLNPPRWPGGPEICDTANLPYFATKAEMRAFQESLCSIYMIEWACAACGGWHFWPKFKSPAGDSSGSGRPQRIPESITQLIKETALP